LNWYGYTGKILNVNLSEQKITIQKENVDDIKQYIGGFGMNCKLASEIIKPGIEPLSEENAIIIGTGPLVGTLAPGSSRIVGITKFPATGAIANSCGSMSFGYFMKNAGYDHIVITGKAEKPIILEVLDSTINMSSAENTWGKDIVETTNILWKEHGQCGVISIGQAGENLVKSAMTLIDKTSTFGRGGLGAVMGFKNLKAIVAKGTMGIQIAQPKEFNKLYDKLHKRILNYPQRESWIKLGMLRSLPVGMLLGIKGQKKKARQCSERNYLKKIKRRRIACPSCPMADKDILELKEGDFSGLLNYTSSIINPFLMFTLDGLSTYDESIKAFDLINRYGLDSLTITALYDFVSKMYEEQLLTEEDIGFKWQNDYKTLEKLIEMVAFRKGFGNILAEGWIKLAAEHKNIKDRMLVIKGLDVVFEPRLLRLGTMEFEQVVNPKGAHVASGGSPTYVGAAGSIDKFKTHFKRMGIPESAFERIFTPPTQDMLLNIGRLTRYSEDWYTILTSQGLCARAQINRFYGLELVTNFYNAVTGLDLNQEDLRAAAERSWNLLRNLNAKEGFSRKDDVFPKEWFKALKFGETKLEIQNFFGSTIITPEIATQLIDDYYDERGWDKSNGLPSQNKLKNFNL